MINRALLIFILLSVAFTSTLRDGVLATAEYVSGRVIFRAANAVYWEDVKPGTEFINYDEIQTEEDSFCELIFREGHIVNIDPNSKLVIHGTKRGRHKGLWQYLKLSVGTVWVRLVKGTNEKEKLLIQTPYVSISRKSGWFSISAPSGKIISYEGNLEVMNGKRKVVVAEGFESDVNDSGTIQAMRPISNEALEAFEEFTSETITGYDKVRLARVLKRLRSQTLKPVRPLSGEKSLHGLKPAPEQVIIKETLKHNDSQSPTLKEVSLKEGLKPLPSEAFDEVKVISVNGRFYAIKANEVVKKQGVFSKMLDYIWERLGY